MPWCLALVLFWHGTKDFCRTSLSGFVFFASSFLLKLPVKVMLKNYNFGQKAFESCYSLNIYICKKKNVFLFPCSVATNKLSLLIVMNSFSCLKHSYLLIFSARRFRTHHRSRKLAERVVAAVLIPQPYPISRIPQSSPFTCKILP